MTKAKAEAFAAEHGIPYIETSALNAQNVIEAFTNISEDILGKVDQGIIDIETEEFGVKKMRTSSMMHSTSMDQLRQKTTTKKKKKDCKC